MEVLGGGAISHERGAPRVASKCLRSVFQRLTPLIREQVCTGAVGFLACWVFIRFIYASVKID